MYHHDDGELKKLQAQPSYENIRHKRIWKFVYPQSK